MEEGKSGNLGMYNNMERSDIRPDLPGDASRKKEQQAEKNKTAINSLKNNEESASKNGVGGVAGGIDAARGIEGAIPYTGGKVAGAIATSVGVKKKKGPIISIFLLLFGFGGLSLGGASLALMPFHIVEQFTEMFDGSFTSRSVRMPKIMKYMFNIENDETEITQKRKALFGDDYVKYRRMSSRTKSKLSAQGIEVIGSGKDAYFQWTNSKTGAVENINADRYGDFYRENTEFRNDMNRGTRGITGRIAAWVDLSVARFLNNHSLTKNLWKNWQQQVFDAEGRDTTFSEIIRGRKPRDDLDIDFGKRDKTTEIVEEEIIDEDGKPQKVEVEQVVDADPQTINMKSKILDVAEIANSVAGMTSSLICGVASVTSTIATIKMAVATMNAMNYFMALAEASDKTRGGDGIESPVHEVAYSLIEKDTSGVSAVESQGMLNIISAGKYRPDINDPVTLSMNLTDAFKTVGTSIGFVVGCSIAGAITAGISVVLETLSLGTFSVGKVLIDVGLSAAIQGVVSQFMPKLLEHVTTDFCLDRIGKERGECMALGGAKALRANFQTGGGMPASKEKVTEYYRQHKLALAWEEEYDRATKSPFDVTTSHTFLGSIYSKMMIPLAQTGSIAGLLSGFASTVSSSISGLLPTANAIDEAVYLGNQLGNCSDLEDIGAVGDLHCDFFTISDMGTMNSDPEEIMNTIADNRGFMMNDDGTVMLDENGVEVINASSNLGKYIMYCTQRQSPFGIVDQNIMNQEASGGSSALKDIIGTVVSAVPIIGSVLDAVHKFKELLSLAWATGANCVAREPGQTTLNTKGGSLSAGGYSDSVDSQTLSLIDWDEIKIYQRYVEDDRLMQSVEGGSGSAVIAFLERYEAEHPVDNSYEGILARKTGYTKDQIIAALNEMKYQEYLAQYDPTELGPLEYMEEVQTLERYNQDDQIDGAVLLAYIPLRYIYYRQEYFTTA